MPRGMDPAVVRQYAASLSAGVVLRCEQPVAEKIKRHVLIAATAQRSIAFLINSNISQFLRGKPELLRRQVLMTQAEHPFMQHDSFIACHDTVRLDTIDQLAAGMQRKTIQRLGYVDLAVCELILKASQGSPLIAPRDQELISSVFRYKLRK